MGKPAPARALEFSEEEFEAAVADALDSVPPELTELMSNVVVLIEDEARPEDADDPILGVYEGTPLTERGFHWAAGSLPDRITLFRRPILDFAKQIDDEAPDECENPDCEGCEPPPPRPHTREQAREFYTAIVRDEITTTVIHEIAHHFGISDGRLHELGWD